MPKYEVIKSPGVQFPVGMTFETDSLHPSMRQHVKPVGVKKPVVEVIDTRIQDADEAYAEALKDNPTPAKPKVEKPPKAAPKPSEGPGENS